MPDGNFVNGFGQIINNFARVIYINMNTSPQRLNSLAAIAAEVLCCGKSDEELAELIQLLNLVLYNVRTYLLK